MEQKDICKYLSYLKFPDGTDYDKVTGRNFYDDTDYLAKENYIDGTYTLKNKFTKQEYNLRITEKGEEYFKNNCNI